MEHLLSTGAGTLACLHAAHVCRSHGIRGAEHVEDDEGAVVDASAVIDGDAATNATESSKEEKGTIAQYLDKQLENEFRNEEMASQNKVDLNETLTKEKVR